MDKQERHMHFLYGTVFIIGAVILNGISMVLGSLTAPIAIVHIHFILAILVALIGLYYLFITFFSDAFFGQDSSH